MVASVSLGIFHVRLRPVRTIPALRPAAQNYVRRIAGYLEGRPRKIRLPLAESVFCTLVPL
eukprot:10085123-Prorocentrum_lima.AAC.1